MKTSTSIYGLSNKNQWTLSALLYLWLGAVVMQLRGAMLPNFQAEFGVTETFLGLVSPAGTIGFTTVALTIGLLAGRIKLRKYIQLGVLLTAFATVLIGLAPIYPLFLAAIAFRGMAGGLPGGLTRPVLSHLYPKNRGKIFNIHEAVWAFGAACGPIAANLILNFSNWRTGYYILGAAFVPIFVLMAATPRFPADINEEPLSVSQLSTIIQNPVIIGVGIGLFLNVGVEGGFFTWLPYYLSQTLPHNVANYALTGFIGAYVPGRLLNSYLVRKFSLSGLVITATSIVAVLLVLAFFVLEGYGQIGVIAAIGFCISTVFPNLFALAARTFPSHSGPINGLIMTFDPLGLSIMPVLMGVISDNFGIQNAMRFLLLPMLGVIAAAIFLRIKTKRGNSAVYQP